MKTILRLEELAMFLACIYLFHFLSFVWWWFPLLLLAPDISMVGYLVNPAVGAYCYNFFHHKGVAIIVLLLGWHFQHHPAMLAGIILLAHSSMDRVFGYGLKYLDSFTNTHLGLIGKQKP